MAHADPQKRSRIVDESASVAHEVLEELNGGALCLKCVATRRRLILSVVQETVARLRGAFLLDTTTPCRACGWRPAITLQGAPAHPAAGSPSTSPRRPRPRAFECAIAGNVVTIQFRSGKSLIEPGRPYVRCSERECQYADLNHAPCPLHPEMFGAFSTPAAHAPVADDGDGRRVLAALETLRPEACCAGCIALTAELSLEDARRAIGALSRQAAVSVDLNGTCSVCGRRQAVMTA